MVRSARIRGKMRVRDDPKTLTRCNNRYNCAAAGRTLSVNATLTTGNDETLPSHW